MEIKKTPIGKYFNKSAINIIKSKFIFFIFSIYEIYEVTICLLIQENSFFYLYHDRTEVNSKLNNILSQISPYLLYCKEKDLKKQSSSYDSNYNFVIVFLILS